MKKELLEIVRGSGNIYRDFDVPDADVRQLKAILATEIIKTLDKKGLSVRKAQSLTGIDAGDFSRVRETIQPRVGVWRFGADVGITEPSPIVLPVIVADARQAYVKFLGEGDNRVLSTFETIEEIKRAGCHWAVAYPASKRPSGVKDDAVIFIGRLTQEPNDIRIFGRAIGIKHEPRRDDATAEDIAIRPWKATWPRYIRVHHAEFVAGTMANGISLNELMDALGADSFVPTQRNAMRREGNTDPRRAYRQQAAVELSNEGLAWLSDCLQAAFDEHGKVAQDILDKLDWPTLP